MRMIEYVSVVLMSIAIFPAHSQDRDPLFVRLNAGLESNVEANASKRVYLGLTLKQDSTLYDRQNERLKKDVKWQLFYELSLKAAKNDEGAWDKIEFSFVPVFRNELQVKQSSSFLLPTHFDRDLELGVKNQITAHLFGIDIDSEKYTENQFKETYFGEDAPPSEGIETFWRLVIDAFGAKWVEHQSQEEGLSSPAFSLLQFDGELGFKFPISSSAVMRFSILGFEHRGELSSLKSAISARFKNGLDIGVEGSANWGLYEEALARIGLRLSYRLW